MGFFTFFQYVRAELMFSVGHKTIHILKLSFMFKHCLIWPPQFSQTVKINTASKNYIIILKLTRENATRKALLQVPSYKSCFQDEHVWQSVLYS